MYERDLLLLNNCDGSTPSVSCIRVGTQKQRNVKVLAGICHFKCDLDPGVKALSAGGLEVFPRLKCYLVDSSFQCLWAKFFTRCTCIKEIRASTLAISETFRDWVERKYIPAFRDLTMPLQSDFDPFRRFAQRRIQYL